jgi:ABC-type branched-subunit amino acid transport system substrate-binding protein
MLRRTAWLMIALSAACTDPKIEVGVYAGTHGATIAMMTARGLRQTNVAKDRWFEARPVARAAVARDSLTDSMLLASLDSMANDTTVVAVVTRFLTSGTMTAVQKFNQVGFPYLSLTPIPPEIVGGSTWGFSLVPDYNKQAAFIAQHVGGGQRVALVHIDDPYGRGMAAALTDALTKVGSKPNDVRSYRQSWDEPRMIALGHETRSGQPTVLVFAGRSPSLTLVIQPFREAGEEIRVIGTDLIESANLYFGSDAALAGVEFVRFVDPTIQEPRMADLKDRYLLWIGFGHITGEGVLTHDGLSLIGDAVRNGARTRGEVREYLLSLGRSRPPYSGVSGLISFGEDGQVNRKIQMAQIGVRGVVPMITDSVASRR